MGICIIHAHKHVHVQNFHINFIKIISTPQRKQLFCETVHSLAVKTTKQALDFFKSRNTRGGIPDPGIGLIQSLINSLSTVSSEILSVTVFSLIHFRN